MHIILFILFPLCFLTDSLWLWLYFTNRFFFVTLYPIKNHLLIISNDVVDLWNHWKGTIRLVTPGYSSLSDIQFLHLVCPILTNCSLNSSLRFFYRKVAISTNPIIKRRLKSNLGTLNPGKLCHQTYNAPFPLPASFVETLDIFRLDITVKSWKNADC